MTTPTESAVQLRRFIEMGPQFGDHGAAANAERHVREIAERVPAGSAEAIQAEQLIAELRNWFTAGPLGDHEAILKRRSELKAKATLLEKAVARFGTHTDG